MASNRIKARVVKHADGSTTTTYTKSGVVQRVKRTSSGGSTTTTQVVQPTSEDRTKAALTQGGKTGVPVVRRTGETTQSAYQRSADATANLLQRDVTVTTPTRRTTTTTPTTDTSKNIKTYPKIQGTGILTPDEITKGLTLKEKQVTQQALEQRSAFIGTTGGAIIYKKDDKVVGVYDPRTNERLIGEGFYPTPQTKTGTQKFFESPEAWYGEKVTKIYSPAFGGRPLSFEEAKTAWYKNPVATAGRNLQIVGSASVVPSTKIGLTVGGAIIEDVGSKPVYNLGLYAAGGVAGRVVGGTKGLITGSKIVTKLGVASKPVQYAARGVKIGAGTLVGGVLGGVVVADIATSKNPLARTSVIAKDFALFDVGFRTTYSQGFLAASELKAGVKESIATKSFSKDLIKQERFLNDPQRLPYRVTKDITSGKTILVEEVDVIGQSRFIERTPVTKSPLGLPPEVSGRLTKATRTDFNSNLYVRSEDLPSGVVGATKEVPFTKSTVVDIKTGKAMEVDPRGVPDILGGSRSRYALVEPVKVGVTPVKTVVEVRPVGKQTTLGRFGDVGKRGQISIGQFGKYGKYEEVYGYQPRLSIKGMGSGIKTGSGKSIVVGKQALYGQRTIGALYGQRQLQLGLQDVWGMQQGSLSAQKIGVQPSQQRIYGQRQRQDVLFRQATYPSQSSDIDAGLIIPTKPIGSFTGTGFGTRDIVRPPKAPSSKVPKIAGFEFGGNKILGKTKAKKLKGTKDISQYTPSLSAVVFDIRGTKAPKGYRSGLVLRPIM